MSNQKGSEDKIGAQRIKEMPGLLSRLGDLYTFIGKVEDEKEIKLMGKRERERNRDIGRDKE